MHASVCVCCVCVMVRVNVTMYVNVYSGSDGVCEAESECEEC